MNSNLINRIRDNEKFRRFVLPITDLQLIRDAMLFIRRDGLIIFSEGYCHPDGKLVGNIIYAPDPEGAKTIFGEPYASVIKSPAVGGEEEGWVDYADQLELYRQLAPESQKNKPPFALYKCVFNLDEMIGYVDHRRSLKVARGLKPEIDDSMNKIAGMLDIDVSNIGCTGSMALGNLKTAHDFDLVFYGTVAEGWHIVNQIYEITKDKRRQVWEYGMFWAIRFFDDWGNLICPFFSYLDASEIPLSDFTMETLKTDSLMTGTVDDDTHTFYMPTVLGMKNVIVDGERSSGDISLILYHGGLRGEYRKGDQVRATGQLVRVSTLQKTFDAFLCTHLNQSEKIS